MTNTEIAEERLENLRDAYSRYEEEDSADTFAAYSSAASEFWAVIYRFHGRGAVIRFVFDDGDVEIDGTGFVFGTNVSFARWLTSEKGSYGGHEIGVAKSVEVK